jgi:hypothetical protein
MMQYMLIIAKALLATGQISVYAASEPVSLSDCVTAQQAYIAKMGDATTTVCMPVERADVHE